MPDLNARELDEAGRVVEAIEAYERLLADGEIAREQVIDLAFIYGECWDFGFSTAHNLDMDFVRSTFFRFKKLIREARRLLGDWPDLQAVELYLPWAALGAVDDKKAQAGLWELHRGGQTLIPALFLPENEDTADARQELVASVKGNRTIRARYIRSVLHAPREPGDYEPPDDIPDPWQIAREFDRAEGRPEDF